MVGCWRGVPVRGSRVEFLSGVLVWGSWVGLWCAPCGIFLRGSFLGLSSGLLARDARLYLFGRRAQLIELGSRRNRDHRGIK